MATVDVAGPGVIYAAAVLAAEGVSFILVGSAALYLLGELPSFPVADVDVVPDPTMANLKALRAGLVSMTIESWIPPSLRSLAELDLLTVETVYGRVDCFLERGRRDSNA